MIKFFFEEYNFFIISLLTNYIHIYIRIGSSQLFKLKITNTKSHFINQNRIIMKI